MKEENCINLKNDLLKEANGCKSLSELVNAFERFCMANAQVSDQEEVTLLFETGTFGLIGKKMFQFSLVRQWPNDDEEYCQLHLDILYRPNEKNSGFSKAVWDEDINTNFFDYVRQSSAYLALEQDKIVKVNIYQDET